MAASEFCIMIIIVIIIIINFGFILRNFHGGMINRERNRLAFETLFVEVNRAYRR